MNYCTNKVSLSFAIKRLAYFPVPVNFAKFLRLPFFTEHLWWLLLQLQNHIFWVSLIMFHKTVTIGSRSVCGKVDFRILPNSGMIELWKIEKARKVTHQWCDSDDMWFKASNKCEHNSTICTFNIEQLVLKKCIVTLMLHLKFRPL